MAEQHYFSEEPQANNRAQSIEFSVLGESFSLQAPSGTFSTQRLDPGTAVLLSHLEQSQRHGNLLDLGCGWGAIATTLAKFSPAATVWALDVNQRSLAATVSNASALGLGNVRAVTAEQIPLDTEFTEIWSNPPIRIGKAALHQLLLTWLPRLAPGGRALLVVQKHLGADSLLRWLIEQLPQFQVERLDSKKGYRIISINRPG